MFKRLGLLYCFLLSSLSFLTAQEIIETQTDSAVSDTIIVQQDKPLNRPEVTEDEDTLKYYGARENGLFTEYSEVDFRPVTYSQLYRPLGRPRYPMARSSNIGLALHSYQVSPQRWSLHYIQGGYLPYILTADSMRYYDVSRPVTILNYENGEKSEQYFSVFHSQNLGEGLNISFEYERITSNGFFVRQLTNHTRFHTTYNLHSKKNRFKSRGYFGISHLEAQENGGIYIDSVNQETDNPALLGVNLFEAQSRSRGRVLSARNSYQLVKFGQDTSRGALQIYHQISWNRSWRNFDDVVDPANPYFTDFFLDSTQTADTSKAEVLRHAFGIQLDNNIELGFIISEYNYFQNFFINEDFSSQHFLVAWQDSLFAHRFRARLKKGVSGYHQEDLQLNAAVSGKVKSLAYGAFFDLENNVVDYFTLKHRTNQHFFSNDFEATTYLNAGIRLSEDRSGVGLKVQLQSLGNYVYFDENAKLMQLSEDIQSINVSLNKEFVFLKHFHLMNKVHWQSISNEEILPMPSLFSYHSLYYDNFFFKNSLHMQIGFDAFVITEYSGYAYSPEQGQFYLNNSGQKLGNIQQVDVFMNLGVTKNGRLFVKMENLLEPTYSQASERIYQYPVPGRALKFGFSWKMIN